MRQALLLAKQAASLGETPVGAVVVRQATGEIIGRGYNRRETDRDPLGHAELTAISQAARALGGWRLVDCAVYVTLEPCPMCAGAIVHARPQLLVYGAPDPRRELRADRYPSSIAVRSGILEAESQALLGDFFRSLRNRKTH